MRLVTQSSVAAGTVHTQYTQHTQTQTQTHEHKHLNKKCEKERAGSWHTQHKKQSTLSQPTPLKPHKTLYSKLGRLSVAIFADVCVQSQGVWYMVSGGAPTWDMEPPWKKACLSVGLEVGMSGGGDGMLGGRCRGNAMRTPSGRFWTI